jgi:uncharacterized protein YraI
MTFWIVRCGSLLPLALILAVNGAGATCVSGVSSGDVLNVRAGPGTQYPIVTSIPGQSCRVVIDLLSCGRNWCRVSYDGKFGWASATFLKDFRKGGSIDFNYYVLQAIYETVGHRANRGYNLRRNYSQDLTYSSEAQTVKRFYWDSTNNDFAYPGGTGATMCVAAVAEVLIEALNKYFQRTKDSTPFQKLPREHWSAGAKPTHLRQHLWEYDGLGSKGAAHALERFNVGKQGKFSELIPGDLFKLNRTSGPGHSTIFIAYLDRTGRVLERHSNEVKGVLYFSAQERGGTDLVGQPSNGFGFRKEYFQGNCPNAEVRSANHCNINSVGSSYEPNVGWMLHPAVWGTVGLNYRTELLAGNLKNLGVPIYGNILSILKKLDINTQSEIQKQVSDELNKSVDPDKIGWFEGP